MPTPTTTATPYCTATQLLVLVDWRSVADWCAEGNGPRPTRQSLIDPTDRVGATVAAKLLAASGDVESCCLRGGIYSVADLQALVGAAAADLQSIVAGSAVIGMAGRRLPLTGKPSDVHLAQWAAEKLESLRVGAKVFGLVDQIEAGGGMRPVEFVESNSPNRTVNLARRYFGNRSRGNC